MEKKTIESMEPERLKEMKFEDLQFIRLTAPEQFKTIPLRLFEQIKEKDSDVIIENLYKFGPAQLNSESNFIYVMVNDRFEIKGVLWAGINEFSENLEVSVLSVDKEYQNSGACEKMFEFLKEIRKEHSLRKIRWMTNRGKSQQRKYEQIYNEIGLKQSDTIIVEM